MDVGHALPRALLAGALAIGLAGCGTGLGPMNGTTRATADNVPPDARGVIAYQSYQVAVARDGDTLQDLAARVGGTTAEELGRLNGLLGDYRFREGEIVALPDSVPRGGFSAVGPAAGGMGATGMGAGGFDTGTSGTGWTPEIATSAIDSAPGASSAAAAPAAPASTADNPFRNGQADLVIDPIRHRVEAGETAYSIARLYGVSVTALASWNGLGPDLAVRENQELLIPVVSGANQIQTGAVETVPGQGTPATPPPSASQPLPENIVATAEPASPELGQYATPPGGRLARPVDGPITRDYNPGGTGSARSDGVNFSVPAGTPVRAAGGGEVALVSESLGGLGTIVLIRHPDDLITVYGRVADVSVTRGQQVSPGQAIGNVAPGGNPGLHFEVRRGTQSVDPMTYLGS